ncbi:hypothetical protein SETIT_6G208800v2 [Setaria italica]|uniref:Uncharacterized protein n=2 Tax=Setaria TaxID=4554 RepID=A0A368RNY2_SETIT|nr:uncharacterized protein LOC111257566 [Setaria italica]RCV31823.1 hypothetical protein SETIT_6G208800v2 [Setaria italica]
MNKITEDLDEYLKVDCSSKEKCSTMWKLEDILARLKNLTNRLGLYSMPKNVMLEESCRDEEDEDDDEDEDSDNWMQDDARKTKRQWICKASKCSEEKDEEKRKTKRQR